VSEVAPGNADIRLARAADCAAVRHLVQAAYAPYVARIGGEPAPMAADYAELISHGHVYVLQLAGQAAIAGVLVLLPERLVLWVDNVAVDPRWQHRGHGRRLLGFAEQQARATGIGEVRLYTHELMVENIRLYQRLGYLEFERRLDNGFRRVFMRKLLESN
jgi:ribosomal protein S18 acetylase RimI-like enzyme